MLKTYELVDRHFAWEKRPRAATEQGDRRISARPGAARAGVVSLDFVCYVDAPRKPAVRKLIEQRMRRRALMPVAIEGAGRQEHWASPETLESEPSSADLVHILSPFDPLIIQRKRLKLFFDYDHRFEAYVPKAKRVFGYFALPVLVGDEIVAAIDLKTDREKGKLLMQKWTWVGDGSARAHKARIEDELHRFEAFQLAG